MHLILSWCIFVVIQGAGALCLQYLLNFSFLRVVRTAFDYGMHILGENQGARTSNPSLVSPPSYHESVTHPSSQYFPSSVAPAGSTEYGLWKLYKIFVFFSKFIFWNLLLKIIL